MGFFTGLEEYNDELFNDEIRLLAIDIPVSIVALLISDVAAQRVEGRAWDQLSYKRLARMTGWAVLFPIIVVVWFRFMVLTFGQYFEEISDSSFVGSLAIVAADQFIGAPIVTAIFIAWNEFFKAKGLAHVWEIVKMRSFPAIKTGWMFWPWIQIVNFNLIPEQYRPIYVIAFVLPWNTFLCMQSFFAKREKRRKAEAEERGVIYQQEGLCASICSVLNTESDPRGDEERTEIAIEKTEKDGEDVDATAVNDIELQEVDVVCKYAEDVEIAKSTDSDTGVDDVVGGEEAERKESV